MAMNGVTSVSGGRNVLRITEESGEERERERGGKRKRTG